MPTLTARCRKRAAEGGLVLGSGGSTVTRVAAQFGNVLNFFFRMRHEGDRTFLCAAGPWGSCAIRLTLGGSLCFDDLG